MTNQNNDVQLSVLGAALTALIRSLHENKVINQEQVLKSMEEFAIRAETSGKPEHKQALTDYIKKLRTNFPD